jgi:predicted GIY-YIG superfamily endonuclease
MLEAIVALPDQLFYNTGIATYILIVTNRKSPERKGKIQLINATGQKDEDDGRSNRFWLKMARSLGNKRKEIGDGKYGKPDQIGFITKIYGDFRKGPFCKIFPNEYFAYWRVTVEQPLKDANGRIETDKNGNPKPDSNLRDYENIPLLCEQNGRLVKQTIEEYFEREVKPHLSACVHAQADAPDLPAPRPSSGQFCIYVLKCLDDSFYIGQTEDFEKRLNQHNRQEVSWTASRLPVEPIHWEIFGTREEAVKREQELKTGFGRKWLIREYDKGTLVAASPACPEHADRRQAGAWIDESKTKVGYEINFTKYFYEFKPLRSLEEIRKDILALEQETEGMIKTVIEE